MEFLQEDLGHGNIATTHIYFVGIQDDNKRNFAQSLMDF